MDQAESASLNWKHFKHQILSRHLWVPWPKTRFPHSACVQSRLQTLRKVRGVGVGSPGSQSVIPNPGSLSETLAHPGPVCVAPGAVLGMLRLSPRGSGGTRSSSGLLGARVRWHCACHCNGSLPVGGWRNFPEALGPPWRFQSPELGAHVCGAWRGGGSRVQPLPGCHLQA